MNGIIALFVAAAILGMIGGILYTHQKKDQKKFENIIKKNGIDKIFEKITKEWMAATPEHIERSIYYKSSRFNITLYFVEWDAKQKKKLKGGLYSDGYIDVTLLQNGNFTVSTPHESQENISVIQIVGGIQYSWSRGKVVKNELFM